MGKIVFSAITGIVLAVGAYLGALAFGASGSDAIGAAGGLSFIAAGTFFSVIFSRTFKRAGFALIAAAFIAAVIAYDFITIAADADAVEIIGVACGSLGAFVGVIIVFITIEDEGVGFLWVFAAYILEALAIGGAFAIDDAVRSAVMALAGVIALLILWGSESRLSLEKHSTRIQQGAD